MSDHFANSLFSAHRAFFFDRCTGAFPAFRSAGSDSIVAVCTAYIASQKPATLDAVKI